MSLSLKPLRPRSADQTLILHYHPTVFEEGTCRLHPTDVKKEWPHVLRRHLAFRCTHADLLPCMKKIW